MAKKTKRELYDEARELYCYTDLSLQEIGEQLGINVNTLYKYSTKEKWVLLKESKVREAIKYKNIILSDRKLRNIKFYETVMDKCENLIKDSEFFKEIKELVATFTIAEDRYFLLSKEKLEVVENEKEEGGNGILDELANL